MRTKIWQMMVACWMVFQSTWAATFEEANASFKAENFTKAAEQYEAILAEDGPSAAIYYNLGNTYQRLGEFGPAILSYERAKLITPRDPDLLANANRARKEGSVFETTEGEGPVYPFFNYYSLNEWSWILVGAAFAGAGIIFFAGLKRLNRRWMRRLAIAGVCVSVLVIGIASTVRMLRSSESELAVVISKEAVIRLSPFETAESVGSPSPGRMVELGKSEGEFRYVTIPDQELSGWMADGEFEALIQE